MAYDTTSVPVSKSQDDIRKLLRKHGADGFLFREEGVNHPDTGEYQRLVALEFVHSEQLVRMVVALKLPDETELHRKARRARTKTLTQIRDEAYEQEEKRIWRVFFHSLKARMVAVEEGVETFEQAFLAHIVDPSSNRTLYHAVLPAIEAGAFRSGGEGLLALEAPR